MGKGGLVFRALVSDADPDTGVISVTVPSFGGHAYQIPITDTGRQAIDGVWKVPDVGAVVLVGADDDNASTLFLIPTYTYDQTIHATDIYGDFSGPTVIVARNDGATTISANTVVTGRADGAEMVVVPANANDSAKPAIGFAVDDIAPDAYGKVAVSGLLAPFNTSTLSANVNLFVGTTGNVVTTPVGLTYPQIVGRVLEVGATGSILIGIENTATEELGSFSGVFNGTVYATAGNLGGSASGWIIDSNRIESRGSTQKIVLDGTDGEIYIGTYGVGAYNSASTPFYVNEDGYFSLGQKLTFDPTTSTLDVNGTITADDGEIGGWTIEANKLSSGTGASSVALASSGGTAIWAGASSPAGATFKVTDSGYLTASGVDLSGRLVATSGSIGNWLIDGGTLKSTTGSAGTPIVLDSTTGKVYVGNENWANTNNRFYVDNLGKFSLGSKLTWDTTNLIVDGTITAASGTIGGWSIDNTKLYAGTGSNYIALSSDNSVEYRTWAGHPTPASAPYYVTKTGGLYASNASIQGNIIATSGSFTGSITGASVSGSSITGGSISGGYITGGSISGGYITGGSVSGGYITGGSVSGGYITGGSISGTSVSGSTVTGGSISGGYITGGSVSGTSISGSTITGGSISGNYITGGSVSGGYITGGSVSGGYITGGSINGSSITGGSVSGGYITGGSVSGGYITGGSINGSSITIGSNFSVNTAGSLTASNASISGNIVATSGSFTGSLTSTSGSIGGFSIGTNTLTAGTGSSAVGIASDSTYPFWAGKTDRYTAPFSVRYDGYVTASSVSVLNFYNTGSSPAIIQGRFTVDGDKVQLGRQVGTGASNTGIYINKTIGTGSSSSSWDNYIYADGTARIGNDTNSLVFDGTDLTVTGKINAASINAQVGNVGGWTLSTSSLYGGSGASYVGVASSGTHAFYAGSSAPSSAAFSVSRTGSLTATSASITGYINATSGSFSGTVNAASINAQVGNVGGFTLGSTSLTAGSGASAVGLNTTGYPFYAGSTTASAANFRVTSTGSLTATSASITGYINATSGSFSGTVNAASINAQVGNVGGFTLGSTSLTAGSGASAVGLNTTGYPFYAGSTTASAANFRVTSTGDLVATSASLTGYINATSGSFSGTVNAASINAQVGNVGGFTLGTTSLTAGTGASSVGLSTTGYPFYAGSSTPASAPFKVTSTGTMTATGASISGYLDGNGLVLRDPTPVWSSSSDIILKVEPNLSVYNGSGTAASMPGLVLYHNAGSSSDTAITWTQGGSDDYMYLQGSGISDARPYLIMGNTGGNSTGGVTSSFGIGGSSTSNGGTSFASSVVSPGAAGQAGSISMRAWKGGYTFNYSSLHLDPANNKADLWATDGTDYGILTVYPTYTDVGRLRIASGGAGIGNVSLTSTTHSLQIGADGATNMLFDNNEIMVRNNGAAANLQLNNNSGHTVSLGAIANNILDTSDRYFLRTNTAHTSPHSVQRGTTSGTTDASGDLTVTFNESFTGNPSVVASPSATNDATVTVHTVSTTGFKVRVRYAGTTQVAVSFTFYWIAIGPNTGMP